MEVRKIYIGIRFMLVKMGKNNMNFKIFYKGFNKKKCEYFLLNKCKIMLYKSDLTFEICFIYYFS